MERKTRPFGDAVYIDGVSNKSYNQVVKLNISVR